MKRTCISVLVLCILLSGCKSWSLGSYQSAVPHITQVDPKQEVSVVSNYRALRERVLQFVYHNATSGDFYLTGYDRETLINDLDRAITDLLANDPLTAYAVDKISYEIGDKATPDRVDLAITYHANRAQLHQIHQAADMEQATTHIQEALNSCDASLVLQVGQYTDVDYVLLVQNYADMYPNRVMEIPAVNVSIYPDHGDKRVVEIVFTYQTSRESLRQMQEYVQTVFEASRLNVVAEANEHIKFEMMHSFLVERNALQQDTSITAAYSLLRYGVGDHKAVAQVFAAMCTNADMTCMVVSGTRNGQPHYWNIVCVDGVYWHVDILRAPDSRVLLLYPDKDMAGYVWDYEAYPRCAGEIIAK